MCAARDGRRLDFYGERNNSGLQGSTHIHVVIMSNILNLEIYAKQSSTTILKVFCRLNNLLRSILGENSKQVMLKKKNTFII